MAEKTDFGRGRSGRELGRAGGAEGQTETFVSIGSGDMTGVYYLVARAVCQIIFRELHAQGIRCPPETTPGSAYNVHHIVSGELEFDPALARA